MNRVELSRTRQRIPKRDLVNAVLCNKPTRKRDLYKRSRPPELAFLLGSCELHSLGTTNTTLNQLWASSPPKDKIVIGRHSLESPGVGKTHLTRYKDYTTGMYDGVHFYGLAALRLIGSISSSNISISSSYDGDLRLVLLDSLHGSELILLAGTD